MARDPNRADFPGIHYVCPPGTYASVKSVFVGDNPSFNWVDYVGWANVLGLKGLVFSLFDSTGGGGSGVGSTWNPSSNLNDAEWRNVQYLVSQPGFLDGIRGAGLTVLGRTICGISGITNAFGEAYAAYQAQAGLDLHGWVFAINDQDWFLNDVDPSSFTANNLGGRTLCLAQSFEALTNYVVPVILETSATLTAMGWNGDPSSSCVLDKVARGMTVFQRNTLYCTWISPIIGTGDNPDFSLSQYFNYTGNSSIPACPSLQLSLGGLGDPKPVGEIANFFNFVSSPTTKNNPITGNPPITKFTVGMIIVHDLFYLTSSFYNYTSSFQFFIANSTFAYWQDWEIVSGKEVDPLSGEHFIRLQQEAPDPLPPAIIGTPWSAIYTYHRLKTVWRETEISADLIPLLPSIYSKWWNPAKWASINVGGTVTALDYTADNLVKGTLTWTQTGKYGDEVCSITLFGTPVDTKPSIANITAFEIHPDNCFPPIYLEAAGETNPLQVFKGKSAFSTPFPTAPSLSATSRSPMGVVNINLDEDISQPINQLSSPYGISTSTPPVPGPPPFPGPGQQYQGGPTATFGQNCPNTIFQVNVHLLNYVYILLTTIPGFTLDAWAYIMCLVQQESGWDQLNTNAPCTPYGHAIGLFQLLTTGDPSCGGTGGGLGLNYSVAYLQNVTNNVQLAYNKLAAGVATVLANGGWDAIANGDKTAFQNGAFSDWFQSREVIVPNFVCLRGEVTSLQWPLKTGVACPTNHGCGISCRYGGACYPNHIGVDFSCSAGSNFQIVTPNVLDPTTWIGLSSGNTDGSPIFSSVDGHVVFL